MMCAWMVVVLCLAVVGQYMGQWVERKVQADRLVQRKKEHYSALLRTALLRRSHEVPCSKDNNLSKSICSCQQKCSKQVPCCCQMTETRLKNKAFSALPHLSGIQEGKCTHAHPAHLPHQSQLRCTGVCMTQTDTHTDRKLQLV